MKKTVLLLSALIFSLSLVIPSLMLADRNHMEEGSGKKMDKSSHGEYKDGKHTKDYKDGKGHMKEGSSDKMEYNKNADHKKMEEGSGMGQKMKMQKKMKMEGRHKEGS